MGDVEDIIASSGYVADIHRNILDYQIGRKAAVVIEAAWASLKCDLQRIIDFPRKA